MEISSLWLALRSRGLRRNAIRALAFEAGITPASRPTAWFTGLSLDTDATRGVVMHDLDRTNQEMNNESFEYEFSAEVEGEEEAEGEQEAEGEGEAQEHEFVAEAELHEMAAELLEVQNDQEMEQFLGNLILHVGSRLPGTGVSNLVGRSLGRALKGLARQIGSAVRTNEDGELEGHAFGLEMEGLSHEDREFEVAKQFVRIATDATGSVLTSPPGGDVNQLTQASVTRAMQRHTPGLMRRARRGVVRSTSGRWIRKGHKIVLLGV